MKLNNLYIIIPSILISCLVIYYFYNQVPKINENFEILKGITTELENITIGEPKIIKDENNNKIINLNIEKNTYYIEKGISESKLDILCCNNFSFYGIKNNASNSNIYYYPEGSKEFQKLNFKLNLPTHINPDYKNKNTCGAHLLNATNKTLWYYNDSLNDMENFNIDCLYYTLLNNDGKPKQNIDDEIEFKCLRLPLLLSNLPTTTKSSTKDTNYNNSNTYITIDNKNATDFIDDNGVNHGKYLQIGELEVYAMINGISTNISNNTNVTKTVTSSSEHGSFPNLQAIDGNPDTFYHSAGGGGGNNEWWKIQFDTLYTIHKIIYFNRKDCCQIRAKGTELKIFNNKNIDNNSTHILNENIKQIIDLPIQTTTKIGDPFTKPDAPYDTIKLIAVNDNILFAVGCHEQINTIYYCKLTDGIPTSNNSSNWKTIHIGNISYIKDIIINDNNVFIISTSYDIYYNKIEFDSNSKLISNFKKINFPSIENSFYSPKFCVSNNIFFIYDKNIINKKITRNGLKQIAIKWFNITNLEQDIEVKKIVFTSDNLYSMPNNLMIYKNFLVANSGINNYIRLELYDDTKTSNETELTLNTIHKMFNPNYEPSYTDSNTSTTTYLTNTPTTTNLNNTPTTTNLNNTPTTTNLNNTPTTTNLNNTQTTQISNNSVTTSGTALPTPTKIPSGNSSPGSFIFGSAFSKGSLLNNEIENISDSNDGIPINDINFEELSGVNMLINGKSNTGNFNDFISKNRVFGNNLFFINKN